MLPIHVHIHKYQEIRRGVSNYHFKSNYRDRDGDGYGEGDGY